MDNKLVTQVVTGKCRLSFCNLFNPASILGSEPKYSVTVLVPKSDLVTKAKLNAAIAAATTEGIKSKWNGVKPPILAIPIYDGDGVKPSDGTPYGAECKGHWVFSCTSKQAPQVVDAAVNPILNQTEIYSGVYGRVSVNFFPYFNSGKKGIGCGLNNVQKLADGEPLAGKRSAVSDFSVVDDGGDIF